MSGPSEKTVVVTSGGGGLGVGGGLGGGGGLGRGLGEGGAGLGGAGLGGLGGGGAHGVIMAIEAEWPPYGRVNVSL